MTILGPFVNCLPLFLWIRYYVLAIDFETYYPVSPPKPDWVHAFYDKIAELKPKRLPLTDVQMHEQWKRQYGYHQAIKYKVGD